MIDTCTGDNSGASLVCGGVHDRVGPMYVLRSTFVNSNQTATEVSLSGGGPGFDPVMYMTSASGGCGANQETCFPSGDTGFPMSVVGIPDGDWLILVTGFDENAPDSCGQVALGFNGSFPVTLEHFQHRLTHEARLGPSARWADAPPLFSQHAYRQQRASVRCVSDTGWANDRTRGGRHRSNRG